MIRILERFVNALIGIEYWVTVPLFLIMLGASAFAIFAEEGLIYAEAGEVRLVDLDLEAEDRIFTPGKHHASGK